VSVAPRSWLARVGPGVITGASDDDPSGIATYSQVGSQFGFGLLWTMALSYPLMASIQEISARIGLVTRPRSGSESAHALSAGVALRGGLPAARRQRHQYRR
jgi:Mn2+/Fe2+ NRAMP family transporter